MKIYEWKDLDYDHHQEDDQGDNDGASSGEQPIVAPDSPPRFPRQYIPNDRAEVWNK